MKRNSLAFWMVLGVLMLPLVASAQKNSIYSWTDENGVQHFSDRAPVETEAVVEEIPVAAPVAEPVTPAAEPEVLTDEPVATLNNEVVDESATDSAAINATAQPSYADQQRQAMAEKRQAQREKQTERERICLRARDELARVEPNRRVYYTDESGETARMDDEQRVQLVEQNKRLVAEFCD